MIDQCASSFSNFILIFLLARGSSPAELGLLLIGYAILVFAVAVCRNAFGTLLGTDLPTTSPEDTKDLVKGSLTGVLVIALLTASALVNYGYMLSTSAEMRTALFLLAAATPLVLVQDLQRYWSVAAGRPHHALTADLLWLAVTAGGFAAQLAGWLGDSMALGVSLWGLGALVGLVLLWAMGYRARPRGNGALSWIVADRRRLRLGADAALNAIAPLANASIVAAIAGAEVTAAVRAAAMLFGPLNVFSAAIAIALIPELIRAGPRRARQLVLGVASVFVLLAGAVAAVLTATPDSWGRELLGASWAASQEIFWIVGIEYAGLGLWVAAIASMRAQGHFKKALRLRVVFSLSLVCLPTLLVAIWPTPAAFAGALAVVAVVLGSATFGVTQRLARP